MLDSSVTVILPICKKTYIQYSVTDKYDDVTMEID
jgi:hypothetical protein